MAVGKRSSEKALRKVLGQGANVNARNPLEVHDPKVGSLISYEGETTADGAVDGSSLIDLVLTTKPDYDGNLVIITSGAYIGQGSDISGVTTAGTVSAHSAFDGQILAGTTFVIVALRAIEIIPTLHASGTQLAVITTEHELATAAVAGVFSLHVDTVNMVAGDVLELRIYQIALTGGASRVAYFMTWYGAQLADELMKISLPITNDLVEANALRFTLLQTFGTGRNFPWKVIRR